MGTLRNTLTVLSLSFGILAFGQDVTDDGQTKDEPDKSVELSELVVKGENSWYEDGKAIFLPRKSAKNLATDIPGLIKRMNTGILTVSEEGVITGPTGSPVNIFINGVPADNLDQATFWPKNAVRVEYMEMSNDPTFEGKRNILNFVMKDYAAGGLTKISAYQTFPNDGKYKAASKLVWGKWTYNALFSGGYSRDHLSGSERSENYEDVWYDKQHFDNITRREEYENADRNNNIYGAFTARYRTDKFTMTHSAALQWTQNPGSISKGSVFYTPEIMTSNALISETSGRSLSPTLIGMYNYTPESKWNVSGWWQFRHSHNNGSSSFAEGGLSPIVTGTRENFYEARLCAMAGFRPRSNMSFRLSFMESRSFYDMVYSGNTSSNQWQSNGETYINFDWYYEPIDNVAINLTPVVTFYDRNINHSIFEKEWLPGCYLTLYYGINRKNTLSFQIWYAQNSPAASMRNNLILRQTELKWIEGNPSLKPKNLYRGSLYYDYRPLNWLNTSISLSYTLDNNTPSILYRPGGSDYDGIIGKYGNSIRMEDYTMVWNIGLTFLDGNLAFNNQLEYNYQKAGQYGNIGYFRVRPNIDWYFGNCSLGASYGSPEKFFTDAGSKKTKTQGFHNLNFSYGNGNFNLDINVNNIFNKRNYTHEWFVNGPYSYDGRSWTNGRNVSVSLTYTFDYGKKVDPSVDISEQNLNSTSALGSDK